jgi:hypothetical protein
VLQALEARVTSLEQTAMQLESARTEISRLRGSLDTQSRRLAELEQVLGGAKGGEMLHGMSAEARLLYEVVQCSWTCLALLLAGCYPPLSSVLQIESAALMVACLRSPAALLATRLNGFARFYLPWNTNSAASKLCLLQHTWPCLTAAQPVPAVSCHVSSGELGSWWQSWTRASTS